VSDSVGPKKAMSMKDYFIDKNMENMVFFYTFLDLRLQQEVEMSVDTQWYATMNCVERQLFVCVVVYKFNIVVVSVSDTDGTCQHWLLPYYYYYYYYLFVLEVHKKNQTVHRKSIKDHVSTVEEWGSVNASTPSLTIASSRITSAYDSDMSSIVLLTDNISSRHFYITTLLTNIVRRPCCVSALTSP